MTSTARKEGYSGQPPLASLLVGVPPVYFVREIFRVDRRREALAQTGRGQQRAAWGEQRRASHCGVELSGGVYAARAAAGSGDSAIGGVP